MELLDYVRVIRAHWAGVALIVLLALGGAGAYTLTQPQIYAANANGFVSAGGASDAAMQSVQDSLAKSRAASYVDIATSRAVAELVIADLGLDASPSSLISNIDVDQPLNTVSIKITARSRSPIEAQQLADAWVRALATQVAELEDPTGTGADGILGVRPVEAAALPSSPVSPKPMLNLALGLVLGALLGVGYAVLRSLVDRRLRSPEEAERRFGVPIVGRLPLTRASGDGDGRVIQVTGAASSDADHWGTGEAFRRLRTNLSYMNVDDPPRVIVVTSARPRDGKSTTAANLAAAIALSGQPVTLIDGDLRRPTVADTLNLVEGAGLTNVLIGQVDLDDVLQTHEEITQLSVLAAGSTPPNPSELLGSHAMLSLLKELSERGMVIIDAPPLLPVTDGAVLTRHSDGAIVVVSHGSTLDTDLEECLRQLAAVQGTVLGVVFNRMPRLTSSYGTYYQQKSPGAEVSGWRGRLSRRKPKAASKPEPGGRRRSKH